MKVLPRQDVTRYIDRCEKVPDGIFLAQDNRLGSRASACPAGPGEPSGRRGRRLRRGDTHQRRVLRRGRSHRPRGLLRERRQSAAVLRGPGDVSAVQPRLVGLFHGAEHRGWEPDRGVLLQEVPVGPEDRRQGGRIRDDGAAYPDQHQGILLPRPPRAAVLPEVPERPRRREMLHPGGDGQRRDRGKQREVRQLDETLQIGGAFELRPRLNATPKRCLRNSAH